VRQVGYLLELYRDARSPENKMKRLIHKKCVSAFYPKYFS